MSNNLYSPRATGLRLYSFLLSKMFGRVILSVLFLCTSCIFIYVSAVDLLELPSPKASRIVLLGTGTPNADPHRSGPSVAVVVNGKPYIVDFGPGIVRRAAAASDNGIFELRARNLKTAFLTHLHSDHTVGYPDLIFSPWVLGRDSPLQVYGPKGLKDMTEHILSAYKEDIKIRTEGLEQANQIGFRVEVHEIEAGEVFEDENISVNAFSVSHGSWPQAFGFRFNTPDRSIVFSGDCRPSQSIIENCSGCDVLIHEVYSAAELERWKNRSPNWAKYMKNFHTSTIELAKIAALAKPKLLILYHQVTTIPDEKLLSEIRALYSGRVVSGKDLEVY